MLALNPTHVFHAGVQLSFLAVATLIWISRFQRWVEIGDYPAAPQEDATLGPYILRKIRQQGRAAAIASVAIWFVSVPLVSHRFHLVPWSGLLLNLFLILPLALSLYSGLAVILFAWFPPLAGCCAWCCRYCLDAMTVVVNGARTCELSHGWVSGPALAGLICFYGILLGFGAFQRFSGRWPLWMGGAFVMLGLVAFGGRTVSNADRELACSFLSVGHGVCIVMELPNDEVWLYDAGSLGAVDSTLREVSSFLWNRGVSRLDGIVISHADLDHFNVIPSLIQRFGVRQICISPAMFLTSDPSLRELIRVIDHQKIPIRYVAGGDDLSRSPWGSMRVCLPLNDEFASEDNSNSVVVELHYFQKRILLTGDLEGEGLARLLESEPLDCDIVMAPHHGSRHSRPTEFVKWSSPDWVVVSGGDPRRAVEATAIFEEAGAQVLHTSERGAIIARLTRDQVNVR